MFSNNLILHALALLICNLLTNSLLKKKKKKKKKKLACKSAVSVKFNRNKLMDVLFWKGPSVSVGTNVAALAP